MKAFSGKVWAPSKWKRGQPKQSVIDTWRRKLKCARGPGHRKEGKRRWRADRAVFQKERRRCTGGMVIEGRVSWFNGPSSSTASGTPVSEPGLALNIAPGTDSGWSNSITHEWMAQASAGDPAIGETVIAGRKADLPVIDLGPSGFTNRAIDVTEAGVYELGLSPAAFPTNSVGRVRIIPRGC